MPGSAQQRATTLSGVLADLWGDALPVTAEPWNVVALDAISIDDLAGKTEGMVVLGDQLPLQTLRELIAAHPDPQGALAALPSGLANRLATGPDAVERSGPPPQGEQHL